MSPPTAIPYMGSVIEVNCFNCGKKVEKRKAEYNRSLRLGRRFFCGYSCSIIIGNKENPKRNPKATDNLKYGNRKDKYTPFRFFIKVMKNRNRKSKWIGDINLDYLMGLWEKQKGICPYTGWKLILPYGTRGFNGANDTHRASIDRIDNSKGYQKGNIQFVSVMANYAKNSFDDGDLIKFCNAVSKNKK